MIYAVMMAIAFIAAVSLATILIVSRKREKEEASGKEEALMAPVSPAKPARQTERVQLTKQDQNDVQDGRELVYQAQRPDRDDFGYTENNPVCTASAVTEEKYLSLLRSSRGEAFQWLKERNIASRAVPGSGSVPVDVYTLFLHGRPVRKIFLCICGKNSASAPKGMKLSTENMAPYGGSISREAREKGISEEQVLKKHALIYESAMQKQRATSTEASLSSERPKPRPVNTGSSGTRAESSSVSEKPAAKPVGNLSAGADGRTGGKEEAPEPASFPNYLPGFEPENIRPSLEKFLTVMDRAYPDGVVLGSTWDHERWDRAAAMLCRYLGYENGTAFLEAYGYQVQK